MQQYWVRNIQLIFFYLIQNQNTEVQLQACQFTEFAYFHVFFLRLVLSFLYRIYTSVLFPSLQFSINLTAAEHCFLQQLIKSDMLLGGVPRFA